MSLAALLLLILQLSRHGACTNLHLLALVPLGNLELDDGSSRNCLDLGEELIPAAQIAAGRINSNPNILADFTLQIIPGGTDRCSNPSIAKALGSFVNFTTSEDIVGIIGLVCPSALLSLSRIASLPAVDILHITSSTTSPSIVANFRKESIGRLYQIAPSSTAYNKAVIALMRKNTWRQISVVRHTDSISIEHDHIGSDFRMRIEQEAGLNISLYSESGSGLVRFVQAVKLSGIRIIYASVTVSEARELLCIAYLDGVSWPNYVWIFHDHSIKDLLHNTTGCSVDMMHSAIEGLVLLHQGTSSDNGRIIDYADYTYGEYYSLYNDTLHNISSQPTCNKDLQIINANAMHDSVIAFAYALNKSLSETSDLDCLGNVGGNQCEATEIVNTNLKQASFSGAGGEISFDSTTHELQSSNSLVNVHQVTNGGLSLLTQFDGILTENNTRFSNISYTFDSIVIRLPLALPVSTLVIVALCIVVTLGVLIFFVHYRHSRDIKATSPLLSLITLLSCFLLYVSAVLTAVRHGFATGQTYANLCASEQFFLVLGVQIIFATLFVRLLRVARIFFKYNPIGVAWTDKALTVYISVIVLITVILFVIWFSLGGFTVEEMVDFVPRSDPPRYTLQLSCSAHKKPLFLALVWGYSAIFMLLVLILAVKTRKVSIDIFKDTKTVNAFIFCSVGILSLFVPLSYITTTLTGTAAQILSYIFQVSSVIVVAVACVILLFVPKIYLVLFGSSSATPSLKTTPISVILGNSSATRLSAGLQKSIEQLV